MVATSEVVSNVRDCGVGGSLQIQYVSVILFTARGNRPICDRGAEVVSLNISLIAAVSGVVSTMIVDC